jgi:hypothetical protein
MPLTTVQAGMLDTTAQYYGFKSRIINGAMVIDQRNAGASVTPGAATVTYTLDRFAAFGTQASKFSVQQNAGSVTPPAGFRNYLGVTSLSAYSVGASEAFWIRQPVEGFNIADFGWGTANAVTVTLSFWVRSSLTGTFGGSIVDNFTPYSYPFSYAISAANTWEQKTVTIVGPTSGSFPTNNTAGFYMIFGLGVGSTLSGTAGSWASANYSSATGATSVVGTNGATFYITGVQLEKGSTATSFDYRPYGTELQLCQRYLPAYNGLGTFSSGGVWQSSSIVRGYFVFPVTTRVAPTGVSTPNISQISCTDDISSTNVATALGSLVQATVYAAAVDFTAASATQARVARVIGNVGTGQLLFTGCEL